MLIIEKPNATPAPELSDAPRQPKLLDRMRAAIRVKHYSLATERTYTHWVKRFIYFHQKRHPDPTTPFEYAVDAALSQPTDTAEADALLARVKLLEDDKAFHAQEWDEMHAELLAAGMNPYGGLRGMLSETIAKLTAARAVIEEAENVFNSLIPTERGWAKLGPAGVDLAVKTRDRIREWKEGK